MVMIFSIFNLHVVLLSPISKRAQYGPKNCNRAAAIIINLTKKLAKKWEIIRFMTSTVEFLTLVVAVWRFGLFHSHRWPLGPTRTNMWLWWIIARARSSPTLPPALLRPPRRSPHSLQRVQSARARARGRMVGPSSRRTSARGRGLAVASALTHRPPSPPSPPPPPSFRDTQGPKLKPHDSSSDLQRT